MDGRGLRILYVSRAYTTHDRRFLQSFAEADCHASFLRLAGETLDSRSLPAGVEPIRWVGETRPLKSVRDYVIRLTALRRILKERRPQAVVAGPVQSGAFLVALAGYQPLITMSWGSDLLVDAQRSWWMRAVTRFILHRSQGMLGDCQAVRDQFRAFSRLPDDRGAFFPWGIDLHRFAPQPSRLRLRRDLSWENAQILICTRSWEPVYAVDVLVRAFARLREVHPQARLLLIGDGSQGPLIRGLIEELGLSGFVHAPGRVDNDLLPDYFRLADVYVSSALSDGTSISLLEAMACGLPAVVTDGYGNVEWVRPGVNGWLVPSGDEHGLAAALIEALDDPRRRGEMGRNNREVACSRADWSRNFPHLLRLLERVAGVPSLRRVA